MSSLKSCCIQFGGNLLRKKGVSEDMKRKDLVKTLKLHDLTFLSIGAMVGSGLYVLTGTIVRTVAGPATVVSYVLAAIASALSAVCYAEFAARIPVAGSAYQFTYISVGEIWAFLIGWNVALEHAVLSSAIARAWSGYLDALFGNPIRDYLTKHCPMPGGLIATYPDFLAVGLILVITAIVASGAKMSSRVNAAFVIINFTVIIFIFCTGIYLSDVKNWIDVKGGFFPKGASGTISGAATLIFSYVGYEVVASATEEAENPQRDVPLSLCLSILAVVFAYVGDTAVLTLMVPWYEVSITSPFPSAYMLRGWYWAQYLISVGALAAMMAAMTAALVVVPRYLFSMARDGIIMSFLGQVNEKTKVPVVATIVSGVFSAIMAAVFSLRTLVEFISIGQLLACTFVAICVIKLRYSPNVIASYERENSLHPVSGATSLDFTQTSSSVVHEDFPLTGAITKASSFSESVSDHVIEEDGGTGNLSGTIKKSVLYSRFGFLFTWTQGYKPGELPFYSLLIALMTSLAGAVMVLFGLEWISREWYIVLLTLFAFIAVICVAFITAFNQYQGMQTFKVPLVPFVPFLSIVINLMLMLKLQPLTWIRLAVWVVVGLVIYFGYGYRHSKAKTDD